MIVVIIQARMGSTRLPRKISHRIQGKSMLAWVIRRTKQIAGVDRVVVATTTRQEDGWVLDEANWYRVQAFQGDEQDVLGRYESVAQRLSLKHNDLIVRITADCPLLDPIVSARVIQCHSHSMDSGCDPQEWPVFYAGNTRDWPDGLDTEVFTRHALQLAFKEASSDEDREHVTSWMKRYLFCKELMHLPNLRSVKFSVDTEEDLEYVRELCAVLGPDFKWGEIRTADPGKICDLCRQGYPHRREVQGMPTRWDLHAKKEGTGIYDPDPECTAWAICQRAAGFPRLSIGAQSPGDVQLNNPNVSPTYPEHSADH